MGLQIKEIIKSRGMTVQDIAERMGISRVGLSQHINGNPSVEVLDRIAKAIGCDISELFEQPQKDEITGFMKVKGELKEIKSIKDLRDILDKLEH